MSHYVIACSTPWFVRIEKSPSFLEHSFSYITRKEDLRIEYLRELRPRYIFFPHWSWIVPEGITNEFECVCFHSTPLPYGRGGSPIQNMIERGHSETQVTALQMTKGLDEGPIYCRRNLSLAGSAEEIFNRIAAVILEMIPFIIEETPVPSPQVGEPTYFKRRTPDQSVLPSGGDLQRIYDHIRMLDAEGYPKAFLTHGDLVLEFDRASLQEDNVMARVIIRKR